MFASNILDLLYPPACLLCETRLDDAAAAWCSPCDQAMPRSSKARCSVCGLHLSGVSDAFDASTTCGQCRKHPPAFTLAAAPRRYEQRVPDAVWQFKYHHQWRIGRQLAQEMADAARAMFPIADMDAVIPVPMHGIRRTLRGFQAAPLLAQWVARHLALTYLPHALRVTHLRPSQTRGGALSRSRNVRQAFAHTRSLADYPRVLLVDDVLTSGATAQACTQALQAAGVRQVFVLTAARTSLHS